MTLLDNNLLSGVRPGCDLRIISRLSKISRACCRWSMVAQSRSFWGWNLGRIKGIFWWAVTQYHISHQGPSIVPLNNCQICSPSLYIHSHCLYSGSQFAFLHFCQQPLNYSLCLQSYPIQSLLYPAASVIFHYMDLIPVTSLMKTLPWSSLQTRWRHLGLSLSTF